MLQLIYSNQLDSLAAQYCQQLRRQPPAPLEEVWVVVENRALAGWLTLQITNTLGICANVRFLLPAEFIWRVLRQIVSEAPAVSPYAPDILRWRILDLLSAPGPASKRLAPSPDYVQAVNTTGQFQFCQQLAEVLDRYSLFRPQWIRDWETNATTPASGSTPLAAWQGALWRSLALPQPLTHWVQCLDAALAQLQNGARINLPAQVSLFALPWLSPAYLQLLHASAQQTPIQIFALNLCREYWGDIESRREQLRQHLRARQQGAASAAPAGVSAGREGQPLLAALGRSGREFFDALVDLPKQESEHYHAPAPCNLLSQVQHEILQLLHPADLPPYPLAGLADGSDDSVQIHNCHSPRREVEVLHDQLLSLFARHTDLTPADVIIMSPDPAQFAPHLRAVFGIAGGKNFIPLDLTDADAALLPALQQTFLALLDLFDSRFEITRVLALLKPDYVAQQFDLTADDVSVLENWLAETHVHFGLDAAQRAQLGLPADSLHTWQYGIDRLLLGFAMPDTSTAYAGLLPYPAASGTRTELLAQLLTFLQRLQRAAALLSGKHSMARWQQILTQLLDDFFTADAEADVDALQLLRRGINELAQQAQLAEVQHRLALAALRVSLERHLRQSLRARGGGLHGGVSVGALAELAGLPAAVICVLGLNDGEFPRLPLLRDFDLLAHTPRARGDRDRRDEDQYRFLLALTAARRVFYVSYCGQDQRDNNERPASVVVEQWLHYLQARVTPPASDPLAGQKARALLVCQHPLQPFSQKYFVAAGDPRHFSYQAELCPAPAPSLPAPFCAVPLATPANAGEISVDALLKFFRHPSRYFFQQCLQVSWREGGSGSQDEEPFELSGLARAAISERVIAALVAGRAPDALLAELRGSGALPAAAAGERELRAAAAAYSALYPRSVDLRAAAAAPVLIDWRASNGWRINGHLSMARAQGNVFWHVAPHSKLRPDHYLQMWIAHVLLHLAKPAPSAPQTHVLTLDASWRLDPLAGGRAEAYLDQLLDYFARGQQRPLPFMPQAAYDYVKQQNGKNPKSAPQALAAVLQKLSSEQRANRDAADPYVRRAFGALEAMLQQTLFAETAAAIMSAVVQAEKT